MGVGIRTISFLVVEDHEFQLLMLEQSLRSLGAERIRSAANGALAARILGEPGAEVDIVISDVKMPEVDGIELIPMLHKAAPQASLLLVSGEEWTLEVGRVIAEGHKVPLLGAVLKPLTPDKLRPLLDAYLARKAQGPGAG
jgi:DNA-binding NarL/FixJ family response regulator